MVAQVQNKELLKCIEVLRKKRFEVELQIQEKETQKAHIQNKIDNLNNNLSKVDKCLEEKEASRAEYDKIIVETEAAYLKIQSSQQALLTVLRRESINISKRKQL